MNTHFASHLRADRDKIKSEFDDLRAADYIDELIGALPYIAAILNKERQIIFSNRTLLKKLAISEEDIIGKRPGEALNCIHSQEMRGGCGTSENCYVCGAVNTILKCQESGRTATDECRIRVHSGEGNEDCLDLEVTAAPFKWRQEDYIIFAARDISSEKRKEALEKVFFHDVINTAGTLQGLVDLLKQIEDPGKTREFIDMLSAVSQDLTEEILNQKSLLAAENGDLAVTRHEFYLNETLENIVKEQQRHELALNKDILLVDQPGEIIVKTDPVLLKRIMNNMIKNALEAIDPEERVSIECSRQNASVRIQVHNPGFMPDQVQKQVFQRSFSTKGKGRGLGTYSMKLLGEKYLEGKVSFSTSREGGTIFSLVLPVNP